MTEASNPNTIPLNPGPPGNPVNPLASPDTVTPRVILNFWLADGMSKDWPSRNLNDLWFGGGDEQDNRIRMLFGKVVKEAVAGGLRDWEAEPASRLALVILLDQFTRNVFRGTAEAFKGDARSQQLVTDGIAKGWDQQLTIAGRVFFYMPLMHAEELALQDECVKRFEQLHAGAPDELKKTLTGNVDFARKHRDIIAKFGRFPYRNKSMGRNSTPEEETFLVNGPRFGQ